MSRREAPVVGVVMGSRLRLAGDGGRRAGAGRVRRRRTRSTSSRRTGCRSEMLAYGEQAADRGLRVIIAGAGGAAHLPGMLASVTPLPVIGVPVPLAHLDGMDSLLSIVQMPAGVPVATVSIGGARNAGLLAVRILGASDDRLRLRMTGSRRSSRVVRPPRARLCGSRSSNPGMGQRAEPSGDLPPLGGLSSWCGSSPGCARSNVTTARWIARSVRPGRCAQELELAVALSDLVYGLYERRLEGRPRPRADAPPRRRHPRRQPALGRGPTARPPRRPPAGADKIHDLLELVRARSTSRSSRCGCCPPTTSPAPRGRARAAAADHRADRDRPRRHGALARPTGGGARPAARRHARGAEGSARRRRRRRRPARQHRRRLRRPARDHRRRPALLASTAPRGHVPGRARRGARRRAHRRAPLHPRSARPRPRHPYVGGAAPVRLPALAERALGVLLLRGVLAGLPPGRLPARAAGLRRPRAPLRA